VVYRADQDTDGVFELYSVPIDGGTVTKLNDPLVAGGNVAASFWIGADSSWVYYQADQETDGVNEVYSVPIDGGTVTKLNDPLVAGGNVPGFDVSADGRWVVYRADQDTNNVWELYSVGEFATFLPVVVTD
jgi:Tol biopolymer transport system component